MPETESEAPAEDPTEEVSEPPKPGERPARHVPVGELADERKARKAAERELTTLQQKVKDFEDRDKTSSQKDADRILELEKALAEKDSVLATKDQDILRRDIAKDKGVPVNLVTGSTREEMEASAETALEWRGGDKPERKPVGALRSGASTVSSTDPKERAAAALRSQWQNR